MGKLRDQLAAAQLARDVFEARQLERAHHDTRADRERSLTLVLSGLAMFYLAIRFGATRQLDALGDYASYAFEISLVGLAFAILRPRLSLRPLVHPLTAIVTIAALTAGFAVLKIARLAGIAVPMDVHNHETVAQLLIVAPVLEELLFRFMLFQPIARAWNEKTAMIATSLLFAYSHLHTIWFVPAEYSRFLIYQTAYTLPLAFACAWVMRRRKSLLSAMLLHAAFNLGFFLAFWI